MSIAGPFGKIVRRRTRGEREYARNGAGDRPEMRSAAAEVGEHTGMLATTAAKEVAAAADVVDETPAANGARESSASSTEDRPFPTLSVGANEGKAGGNGSGLAPAASTPNASGKPARLPRNEFRKQRKLERRRRVRQQIAIARQQRRDILSTPFVKFPCPTISKTRKEAWECREQEIEEENAIRRAEAEKKQKRQHAIKVLCTNPIVLSFPKQLARQISANIQAGLAKATALAKKLTSWIPPSYALPALNKGSLSLSDIGASSGIPAAKRRRVAGRRPAISSGVRRTVAVRRGATRGSFYCLLVLANELYRTGTPGELSAPRQVRYLPSWRSVYPGAPAPFVKLDAGFPGDVTPGIRIVIHGSLLLCKISHTCKSNLNKCCRNNNKKLHGNVYIQYADVEQARNARSAMAGRHHAGRRLLATYSPIVNWHSAICGPFGRRMPLSSLVLIRLVYAQHRDSFFRAGLFAKGCCPNGDKCSYIHVYHNPTGMFQQGILDVDVASAARDTSVLQDVPPEIVDWELLTPVDASGDMLEDEMGSPAEVSTTTAEEAPAKVSTTAAEAAPAEVLTTAAEAAPAEVLTTTAEAAPTMQGHHAVTQQVAYYFVRCRPRFTSHNAVYDIPCTLKVVLRFGLELSSLANNVRIVSSANSGRWCAVLHGGHGLPHCLTAKWKRAPDRYGGKCSSKSQIVEPSYPAFTTTVESLVVRQRAYPPVTQCVLENPSAPFWLLAVFSHTGNELPVLHNEHTPVRNKAAVIKNWPI
ncbi:MAG: hypothetical protein BJ554DRAFT_784 [Olpidium bornovanus]|uniref:C3H1-type domain-containing protein n=1 Tax=Olpidium bornovanus TaxID=278681 RepID=A0A8H7ZSV4_9FUNG|nr:MAG: hypothetical protein BJ554DRAFT_784 [Olpidium bornovanus]